MLFVKPKVEHTFCVDRQGDLQVRNHTPSGLKPAIDRYKTTGNERSYTVEAILAHKSDPKHKYLYKVRWKGYSVDHDTWEPPSSFDDPKAISAYWHRIGQQEPPKKNGRKRGLSGSKSSNSNSRKKQKKTKSNPSGKNE